MFIVIMKLAEGRARAAELLPGHKAWIEAGVGRGEFLLVGSLQPKEGGAILAHGLDRPAMERLLAEDPFVQHGVVRQEVFEVAPNHLDDRLAFLAG